MHTNVKTASGDLSFLFLWILSSFGIGGIHIGYIKTLDDPIPLLTYFKPELFAFVFVPLALCDWLESVVRGKSLVFSLVSLRRSSRYFS